MVKQQHSAGLRMLTPLLPLLASFVPVYASTNDWSTPCFDGVCQYSLVGSNSSQTGSGTLKIWGSSDAITDITTAAGWEILNCSSTALTQDIRLVCMSDNTTSSGCDHLFQGNGAEDKIVRLPENCGASPFARIARAYVPEDQSIPANISKRIVRRDGSTPQVKALTLDTNFSAIDVSKTGTVNIAIRGANFPGANVANLSVPSSGSRRRSCLQNRGLSDFVGDAIKSLSETVNDFNFTQSVDLPQISANKSATLLNTDLSCGDLKLNLDVGVDGAASAQASLGVAASGTIIPPELDEFAVIVGLNANLDGSIDISADVGGTFDTGKVTIFSVGIPGLDIPGILSIGPSFDIDAQATAELDVDVDLSVGVNYAVTNAQLVFPPNSDLSSGGSFDINDTPLKLSLSPGAKATGNVTAHLIPTLSLGVSVLSGVADATVFLDLDASATLLLDLDALDNTNVTIGDSDIVQTASVSASASSDSAIAIASKRYVLPRPTSIPRAVSSAKRAAVAAAASSSASASAAVSSSAASGTNVTTSSSGSFGGCVELDVGFDVNAGAEGSLFGLFSDSTQVTLFSKEFQLFQKCFGDEAAAASKRELFESQSLVRRSSLEERTTVRRPRDAADSVLSLICPSSDVQDAESIVDEVVQALGITSI